MKQLILLLVALLIGLGSVLYYRSDIMAVKAKLTTSMQRIPGDLQ